MISVKSKRYYIKTFGCYANEVDSDYTAGFLEKLGFKELKRKVGNETTEIKHALKNSDILIINSCSVRQKSEDKVYGIGKMVKDCKDVRAKVFLTGCMVGSVTGDRKRFSKKELQEKTKSYDDYFSPGDLNELLKLLKKHDLVKKDVGFEGMVLGRRQKDKNHAYVNVSYGCDNFCSYCVVPYSRGCEISRSEKEILEEIKCLVKKGVSEFTLCGQNVNSWGLGKAEKFNIRVGDGNKSDRKLPFAELLRKVHRIKGVEKIDFISSNPFDFTQDLVEILKLPKISNYIHIAAQSGNNDILKAMNRRHTKEEFVDLIERIRKVRPDVEIGSDLIVGFPGETREQFMDTVDLVKKIGFSVAFISMYSPRKGTFAERNLRDDVPLKEKKWRHMYLSKIWKQSKPSRSKGNYHSRWENRG
jgi:tRNA-2-methylthio-N6-dimethylallyladenosine synthase